MRQTQPTGPARGKGEHPWVQPIIVAKEGTHEDTVLAGAQASVALYVSAWDWPNSSVPDDAWDQWLSGPRSLGTRSAWARTP